MTHSIRHAVAPTIEQAEADKGSAMWISRGGAQLKAPGKLITQIRTATCIVTMIA